MSMRTGDIGVQEYKSSGVQEIQEYQMSGNDIIIMHSQVIQVSGVKYNISSTGVIYHVSSMA